MGMGAAIVGSAIVGGVMSSKAASKSAKAVSSAAASSADATLQSTLAQLEEMQYQFDYSNAALAEGRQIQYNAGNAFATMLGINGPKTGQISERPTGYPTYDSITGKVTGAQGGQQPTYSKEYDTRQSRIDEIQAEMDAGAPSLSKSGANQAKRERDWYQMRNSELNNLQTQQDREQESVYNAQYGDGNYFKGRDGTPQQFGANIQYQPTVGERGFVDPMADPTLMAGTDLQDDLLYGNVAANRLAGPSIESDPFAQYTRESAGYGNVAARQLAGPTYGEDPYFSRVEDTAYTPGTYTPEGYTPERYTAGSYTPESITSDTFEASPGYNWLVEETMRQAENKASAGGNYGGAAMKEAARMAKGLAGQEYYNWANVRAGDLNRMDTASQFNIRGEDTASQFNLGRQDVADQFQLGREDVADRFNIGTDVDEQRFQLGREDVAMQNYLSRQGMDASRLDQQMNIDTARNDQAFMDYLDRQGIDINRLDNASLNYLQRQQYDVSRKDANLSNFMSRLGATSGLGGDVQASVAGAQQTGGQMANIYRNQGNTMANIYQNRGAGEAMAAQQQYAGINNAIQSGVGNYLTYDMLQSDGGLYGGRGGYGYGGYGGGGGDGLPMGVGNAYANYS